MKKLFYSLLSVLALSLSAFADGITTVPLTANVISNIVSGSYLVDNITVIATTTNLTTVNFYDSSTASTNMTRAAYTKYQGYSTNYSQVFTNESGILLTNSYSGWYTAPVAVSSGTINRPLLYTITTPGSVITSKDVNILTLRGLSAMSTYGATVLVSYRGNP